MEKANGKKIRSVDQYLALLKAAGRSDITIRNYRQVLKQYSEFLSVPLNELHKHLDPDDLVRYASAIAHKRDAGRKSTMVTIRRYLAINGVEFDELEANVAKVQLTQERSDKPVTVDLLQRMMDQATPLGRSLISFLVSTGCRAGETSKLLLSDIGRIENGRFISDINGDVVRVRNEIAKRKKGGLVFLTKEAREYLTVWLKNRDQFVKDADARTERLYVAPKGGKKHDTAPRKENGTKATRPANDQRIFACTYSGLDKTFNRLYRAVDGERGATGNKVTIHGCRAFFRTMAAKTMGIDLAEGLLRHSGYLNEAYVRMTLEDIQKQFHAGEAALYITRADHRIQGSKLDALTIEIDALTREKASLLERVQQLERIKRNEKMLDTIPLSDEDRLVISKMVADELKKNAASSQ